MSFACFIFYSLLRYEEFYSQFFRVRFYAFHRTRKNPSLGFVRILGVCRLPLCAQMFDKIWFDKYISFLPIRRLYIPSIWMSETAPQNEVFETPDQEATFQPYTPVSSSSIHAIERDIGYSGRYQDDTKGFLDKVTVLLSCVIIIVILHYITNIGKCRSRWKCACTSSSIRSVHGENIQCASSCPSHYPVTWP